MKSNAPLVRKVCFVPHKHNDHVIPPLRAYIVYPFSGGQKGLAVCESRRSVQLYHKSYSVHALVISKTTMATDESRMYEGIRDRKRSCRYDIAYQSHSTMAELIIIYLPCSVPQLQANCPVLQIHSLAQEVDTNGCLVCVVESIIHKPILFKTSNQSGCIHRHVQEQVFEHASNVRMRRQKRAW